jgi:hypothetical protein
MLGNLSVGLESELDGFAHAASADAEWLQALATRVGGNPEAQKTSSSLLAVLILVA